MASNNYPYTDPDDSIALYRLHELGADISEACEGHETTNGPAGVSDYCNGTCQTRRRI